MKGSIHQQCKNCGNDLSNNDNYCSNCGQKNIDYNLKLRDLIQEFADELMSWDSRLFHTFIPFITNPAKLSKAYLEGKRVKYVQPFRIYLVCSIVFFFLFNHLVVTDDGIVINKSGKEKVKNKSEEKKENSIPFSVIDFGKDSVINEVTVNGDRFDKKIIEAYKNETVLTNDFIRDSLGVKEWINVIIIKQGQKIYNDNGKTLKQSIFANMSVAVMLLVPLFALYLKLFYIRKRGGIKNLYIQHLVFSTHLHAFTLFCFTLMILISHFGPEDFSALINTFIWLYSFVMTFVMMKKFYGQSWIKTIIKGSLAMHIHFVSMFFFAILEVILSALIF
ncbi:DUF3667 domain-containing protein [Flammeovirga yaeyamensis]|uniref:DUF3667 domain-containing protein n=2 Tax=Flammeovirga yaeyamensis TaxID=367791 RepID=A0AAX1ND07_9BACT|nr:DUF3667 domain-containing protein [Flammeovirga yaeyamensis]MBB3699060.1 hypothetical protein [Flammeovirga yaeyamensis]NMF36494.1 DUF3667 domain-containing protein [Flammeovirga yaeyamensis]QWG03548.1 DUF3667 domain-containing protein [Flammeovirga yaeyamensis]